MSDREPSREDLVQAVFAIAEGKMKNRALTQQVQSRLVEKGLDQESAATFVSNLTRIRSEAFRKVAKKSMLYGARWCIGGIVVTAATYSAASDVGKFVVALGEEAILSGAIAIVVGASLFVRSCCPK